MMLADLERGKGKLLIRQTDMDAFEVGRNTAVSPGAVVFENDLIQLIQYAPATEKVYAKPLLIIPPWINKFYILDLNPKKSMVKWLVEQGHTVFVVSWVNPDQRHGQKTWEDYMFEGGLAAIDKVLEETGQKSLHLASYCVGGTMGGTLMAWLGKTGDKRVASGDLLHRAARLRGRGRAADLRRRAHPRGGRRGHGEGLHAGRPDGQRLQHAAGERPDLGLHGLELHAREGPVPVRPALLERRFDGDAGAGAPLLSRTSSTSGTPSPRASSPRAARRSRSPTSSGPVYHVATREDHIAPAASVYRGAKEMTRAKVRFVLSGSGHIAGVVNPPVLGKYQYWTNPDMSKPTLEEWLQDAEETPGSWWPDWHAWLQARSQAQVPAREPGARLGALAGGARLLRQGAVRQPVAVGPASEARVDREAVAERARPGP